MTTQELIETTKELIRIPSTADNPAALQQAVEGVAAIIKDCPDVTIERFERNGKPSLLAYRGTSRPEEFDILLNAHLDVVPGQPALFEPYEKNGRLYGRGALDMKGTAVVLADVFRETVNAVPYDLGIQIVTDEEIGGYDGVCLQIDEGVRSKFIIMGEYANDRNTIYNAARGLCWAEIAFKGRSAHGGHLWHGSNAVVKAGAFGAAVLDHYPTPDKETWTTTASIANLSTTNDTYNKVPDMAVLKIDFRFTQEDPVFENRETLESFIASIDPEAELVKLETFEPAVKVEELNPYVQGLSAAVREITQAEPQFQSRPAGSDGRHYALVNNDIIEYGLYGKHSHSDNEYVELSSFAEYKAILSSFLSNPLPDGKPTLRNTAEEQLHSKLLKQLVAMPTTSGDTIGNNKALNFIEQFLQTRGMYVERHESEGFGSLLATTRPGNKQPKVLLSAHIDVVPGSSQQFSVTTSKGRVYGRGVMDMKFAIANYLSLADSLRHDLQQYDFGILVTSDEEIGGRNGTNVLVNQLGLRPKVAVIPDGGENWQIETFAKGVQWIKLEATGKSAHASRPWEGSNAISALLAALHEIELLIPKTDDRKATSLSVGTIEGGTAGNQIPAHASAMLDVRLGNIEDFKVLPKKIHDICTRYGVTDTLLVGDPPCINNPEDPYVKPFMQLIETVTGAEPRTAFSHGATDGRYFSAVGIPVIIVSPESGGRHTDSEWLQQKGFDQFDTVLKQYVMQMALTENVKSSPDTKPAHTQHPQNATAADDTYVWHAAYGSGLSRDIQMCILQGGKPEGATTPYPGCTDKSAPLKDEFISLPYDLYFAGTSPVWGGGYVMIHPKRDPRVHTIARIYLIKLGQLKEIIAQHNKRGAVLDLPIERAIRQGHATIGDGTDNYDELVYCGEKDGYPIFAVTTTKPRLPYVPPSAAYARMLYKGLSENSKLTLQKAVSYVLSKPGVAGNYLEHEITKLFADAAMDQAAMLSAPVKKLSKSKQRNTPNE